MSKAAIDWYNSVSIERLRTHLGHLHNLGKHRKLQNETMSLTLDIPIVEKMVKDYWDAAVEQDKLMSLWAEQMQTEYTTYACNLFFPDIYKAGMLLGEYPYNTIAFNAVLYNNIHLLVKGKNAND